MLQILTATPDSMYLISTSSNVDIKPGGLDFISLDISDYAEPGDSFQITLSDTDPLLTYESQLYIVRDKFQQRDWAFTDCYHITPFFVTGATREFGKTTYDCVKVYKGYLNIPAVFQGEVL